MLCFQVILGILERECIVKNMGPDSEVSLFYLLLKPFKLDIINRLCGKNWTWGEELFNKTEAKQDITF